MSIMGPNGKILIAGGGGAWWSPFGDTDEEIQENMKTGHMPNAPDAVKVMGPGRTSRDKTCTTTGKATKQSGT